MMCDIGLFSWRQNSRFSSLRQQWEKNSTKRSSLIWQTPRLRLRGVYKALIVRKAIPERKDPRRVAWETLADVLK